MVIYRRGEALFTIENSQLATLGVDVVVGTGSKVFNQISWLFLAVNLNVINSGICVVGKDKVDNTITAKSTARKTGNSFADRFFAMSPNTGGTARIPRLHIAICDAISDCDACFPKCPGVI